MPGLVGFASQAPLSAKQLDARLEALENALTITHRHRVHRVLYGPRVGGAAICPAWQPAPVVQTPAGLTLWLDGTCFNREDLARRSNLRFQSDADFFLTAIADPLGRTLLKAIDGLFSAVVFDAHKNLLHIATDRYGLRPLYWLRTRNQIAWASETKAFFSLPDVSPHIDEEARETFFATGQLPAGRTFLSGIEPVPPGTRITFRLADGALTRERYWHWHDLTTTTGNHSLTDLTEELARLFIAAVERRATDHRPGLVLSGGLDSRAILAALPSAPRTYTFGKKNSPDVTIAARAAAVKNAPHTTLPLNAQNWLLPRISGVWQTDGALNLLHLHGIEHLHQIADDVDICFNGAGGDGLVGGGHLFPPHEVDTYLRDTLHLALDTHPAIAATLRETFNRTGSAHVFYIDWRMRSFTIHGPRFCLFQGMDYRLPFMDNAVQEFLYGLPLETKRHNRLYRAMLLSAFPAYFKTIPWQATGYPLSYPTWAIKGARLFRKLSRKKNRRDFADYPAWLRMPPARTLCETLLLNPRALMFEHVNASTVEHLWNEHLQGADRAETIGRYLTYELYLQQVFNGAYRTEEDAQKLVRQ